MDDYTIYARGELLSLPENETPAEGYWSTDFAWNVGRDDLVEWASGHSESIRFRAIAFEPVGKKENK